MSGSGKIRAGHSLTATLPPAPRRGPKNCVEKPSEPLARSVFLSFGPSTARFLSFFAKKERKWGVE
jgi:hypothetical protein